MNPKGKNNTKTTDAIRNFTPAVPQKATGGILKLAKGALAGVRDA
ncbi:MAG: hypothetical protein Nk1A_7680 [Endomicrobiia bacterium]|nr:MAG: hypothetical protein Nk1A_7680 [Endomicrobiia bacterium]